MVCWKQEENHRTLDGAILKALRVIMKYEMLANELHRTERV